MIHETEIGAGAFKSQCLKLLDNVALNNQRLSTAPQSPPKRITSGAADKPRWTEPLHVNRSDR